MDAVSATDETRKVVTVLFSDVEGSTALGEQLDPESVRSLMQRYFTEARTVLERHGGMVEKFIGDAVMAVFGVPRVHEDDALRAVRAAIELQRVLDELNDGFTRSWGVTLTTRTGVNTGEVIAGDPRSGQTLVVGDAINLASRLEQSAGPGEILIGAATERLVRDAVVADPVGPLALKGIAEPVSAFRLREVVPDAPGWARNLDSPLVGREPELVALRTAFARASERNSCELVTVIGPAGVGKSRLVQEFVAGAAGEATVITGRCLPYGTGITFWPIVGVLRDAAAIGDDDTPEQARTKLEDLLGREGDGPVVAAPLAALLGLEPSPPGIQETFWSVRKLFERLASTRPLAVVLDDIQWGEATFLDLVEYVTDWIGAAPVLVVCMARPELFDEGIRPAWAMGKSNATVVRLEPLTKDESDGLISNLLGGAELAPEARVRIAGVAEGNPLFLEQTLRMLVDDGVLEPQDGRWRVAGDLSTIAMPPTIHAVLTARLERLEEPQRAAIERASVIGRVFWWGAVSELSGEQRRADVGPSLQALARKGLIQPDRSELAQEDAFRFTHALVRDAAYNLVPKSLRAELHKRFAEWATPRTRDSVGEYEEILGYHLEQAYGYEVELGLQRAEAEATARAAAAHLASAGRRAFARGDMPAAVKLLARAASLYPESDPQRIAVLPQLAFARLETGDFPGLQEATAETSAAAEAFGDPALRANATILNLWIRLFTDPVGWAAEAEPEAQRAATAFAEAGDDRGLTKAWSLLALVHMFMCRFGQAEEAWLAAAEHAAGAGDRRDELESLAWVPLTVWAGPSDADPGLARCEQVLERVRGDKKAMASVLIAKAAFEAGKGRIGEARALVADAKALLEEAALTVWLRGPLAQFAGWAELLGGDAEAAERELRAGYDVLAEIGEVAWLSTVAAILAEAVYSQGRVDEADELTRVSEASSAPDDLYSQTMWRAVRAKVLARRGEEAAEDLAHEAVRLTERGDFLQLRWYALMTFAEVLELGGEPEAASKPARNALAVAEQKGSTVAAERARTLLERLETTGVSPG